MTISIQEFIISDPNLRSGRPVIAGTSLRVLDIAALTNYQGRTPDDIAVSYGLTLAQVHAALAYYYANKAEIDADLQHQDDLIREAKEKSFGKR